MVDTHASPFIHFTDLVANPYLISFQNAIHEALPEAYWWIADETLKQYPFPTPNNAPPCFSNIGETAIPEFISVLQTKAAKVGYQQNETFVHECCEERLQGFVPFYYRNHFWGGVGICGVPAGKREVLENILRSIQGYFALLSGSLEDHDDLELMHAIWAETITVVDVDALLDRLAEELCRVLDIGHGAILLLNEDGEFYPAHVKSYPQEILKRRNLRVTRYEYAEPPMFTGTAMPKLAGDDPLKCWLANQLKSIGHFSDDSLVECWMVPFYRNTVLIGMFLTFDPAPKRLSELKRSLVRLLATGGAAALDNALTLERMNKRRKALATIHVVHRLMSSSVAMDEILPKIGQLTRQLLQAQKCSIMLCDESKERLLPTIHLGLEDDEVGRQPLSMGEGLPGWVAENFNPVIYHPSVDPAPPWISVGETYPAESYLSVALFDTDIEGVVTVAEKPGDFTPGDREILVTFADQVVLAIKNARAHEGERTITINALKSIANLIETHDPAKPGVTAYTCQWSQRIAKAMRLPERERRNIIYAALLHETGMLRTFQGEITFEELRRKGPQLSVRVVESLGLSLKVGEIVYHINEAWNGEGYPEGLQGEQIPLGSRIVAVANAYATLLNRMGPVSSLDKAGFLQAYRILARLSNRAYDPKIVQQIERIIRETTEVDLRAV